MPPERLERLTNLVGVVAVAALRQVFEARERGERRLLSGFECGHLRLALLTKVCRFHRSVRPRGLGLRCLETDSKLVEPFLRLRRWSPRQRIAAPGRLPKGDPFANPGIPANQAD